MTILPSNRQNLPAQRRGLKRRTHQKNKILLTERKLLVQKRVLTMLLNQRILQEMSKI